MERRKGVGRALTYPCSGRVKGDWLQRSRSELQLNYNIDDEAQRSYESRVRFVGR